MISAVIIDDEKNNIDNLQNLLSRHCPQVTVRAVALNADEGEKIIRELEPELVFLDIQMPGRNGFDLLKSLNHYSFGIIFVTAFDQYGIQAVKFSAIDYLLKPVDAGELTEAVQKAIEKTSLKKQNLRLENLIQVLSSGGQKAEHRIARKENAKRNSLKFFLFGPYAFLCVLCLSKAPRAK